MSFKRSSEKGYIWDKAIGEGFGLRNYVKDLLCELIKGNNRLYNVYCRTGMRKDRLYSIADTLADLGLVEKVREAKGYRYVITPKGRRFLEELH